MTDSNTPTATPPPSVVPPSRPLRLWPGVTIVAIQWFVWLVVPAIMPAAQIAGLLAGVGGGALVLVWWLFFSRAPWLERIGAILLIVAALAVTLKLVHPSIAGGAMGYLLYFIAAPVLSLALVAWAVATRRLAAGPRRAALVGSIGVACGVFTLLRTGGISGSAGMDLHWRWTPTPEERLLASAAEVVSKQVPPVVVAENATAQWPGFRGAGRDGIVRGVRIETNWTASPPIELWRRPVGPGWSSFAVGNGLIYTQEQRGEVEVVACYQLATGEPVWRHEDATRFYESNAGPGPRGTPTLHDGRVYTFGATGVVNALDALTGAVRWMRNAATDTKKTAPDWGFASSPLVVGDLVVVAATGSLVAYDRATGTPKWFGPADGKSYSSPHLTSIDGVSQILLMSGIGLTSVSPADGKVLWQHEWPSFAIVQPAQLPNGDLVISTGDRLGARRIEVKQKDGAWAVNERWSSTRLKAYFNDYVLHQGHAYGFDGGILACVDLEDGERKWKGGRYGSGQVILLADQDVLLVLAEQGGLALVSATPGEFNELASTKALEGKTWNHPVLAGDVLLVRNDHEMVALRLAVSPAKVAANQ